jgi:hypothetical protein
VALGAVGVAGVTGVTVVGAGSSTPVSLVRSASTSAMPAALSSKEDTAGAVAALASFLPAPPTVKIRARPMATAAAARSPPYT